MTCKTMVVPESGANPPGDDGGPSLNLQWIGIGGLALVAFSQVRKR